MDTTDYSSMIVTYNLIIGILVMLSSEKLGTYAGGLYHARRERIARLTSVSTFAFGTCVATLSAAILLLFHVLRIGL
jgi:energy-converting hydrogenase Eha subunit A